VEVEFLRTTDDDFGGWLYTVSGSPDDWKKGKGLPTLKLWIYDPADEIAEAIYEAHCAALWSGERKSDLRFFKAPYHALATTKIIRDGYSDQHPLLGMVSWSICQARSLPNWAVPFSSRRFSIENLPASHDLEL
jgi:hypothetical protein